MHSCANPHRASFRHFVRSTQTKRRKKDRVGVAGEPEMPTKTYVCLKHGVQFEPLEKVVFDERLFSFYVFSLPPSLFPDVFTSGLNLKKTLALDFSIINEFPAIVVKTLFLKVPKWMGWFDLDQRDETGRRSQLPAAATTKNIG